MFVAEVDPNKVAVYIRWSTDDQTNGTTLEVQRDACEYYIKSQGWNFNTALVYVDDGYSGGNMDRPALTQLRSAVSEGRVQCVVVYKLDRLSRSVIDTVNLVLKEWEGRSYVKSAREPIDTTTAMGKQFFYMLVSYAEWERNVIRERTAAGRYKRAQAGRKAGSTYPYGYKGGPNGEWLLDGWDEENRCFTGAAAIMRRIYDEYLVGRGWKVIADGLRRDGIKSPKGKLWRADTIHRLITNPVYYGLYQYGNKTHQGRKTPGPHFEVEGKVPPIVSKEDFDEAERIRRDRGSRSPRTLGSVHLLSGILKCAKCGGPMKATRNNRGDDYYICLNKTNVGTCDAASIREDMLETAVLDHVKQMLSKESITSQIGQIEASVRQQVAERAEVVKSLERELSGLKRREQKLDRDYDDEHIDGKTYARALDKCHRQMAEVEAKLESARGALRDAQAVTVDTEKLRRLSGQVDAWSHLSREEVKQLLRDVIERLEVTRERGRGGRGKKNQNPIYIRWYPRTDSLMTIRDNCASD